jgi:hypothetical protein
MRLHRTRQLQYLIFRSPCSPRSRRQFPEYFRLSRNPPCNATKMPGSFRNSHEIMDNGTAVDQQETVRGEIVHVIATGAVAGRCKAIAKTFFETCSSGFVRHWRPRDLRPKLATPLQTSGSLWSDIPLEASSKIVAQQLLPRCLGGTCTVIIFPGVDTPHLAAHAGRRHALAAHARLPNPEEIDGFTRLGGIRKWTTEHHSRKHVCMMCWTRQTSSTVGLRRPADWTGHGALSMLRVLCLAGGTGGPIVDHVLRFPFPRATCELPLRVMGPMGNHRFLNVWAASGEACTLRVYPGVPGVPVASFHGGLFSICKICLLHVALDTDIGFDVCGELVEYCCVRVSSQEISSRSRTNQDSNVHDGLCAVVRSPFSLLATVSHARRSHARTRLLSG